MNFSYTEQILISIAIGSSLSSFSWELIKRYGIISKGEGKFNFDRIPSRLLRVLDEFLLQRKVISQRFIPGLMHAFVFWGFIAFSLITIDHFLRGYNLFLFTDSIRNYYGLFFGIPWSILVLIGILYLAYRRFYLRPKYLGEKTSYTSGIVATFICLLMVTYLIDIFWVITNHHPSILLYKFVWWLHGLLILGFLILIPKSKHLHLVLSLVNIFFKSFETPNHRPIPIDMEGDEEELENLLSSMDRLSKKQTLDIF